jgi:acid stress chaperone HdeB
MIHKILLSCAALATVLASPAKAQVVVDMSLITCQQYQDSDSQRQQLIAYWMSGYFSAAKNFTTLDFRYFDYNKKVVTAYCKTHKFETLMSAIQRNAR